MPSVCAISRSSGTGATWRLRDIQHRGPKPLTEQADCREPTSLDRMNLPRAKKGLGQIFLVDERVAARIVGELDPQGTETIVEIGPGRGALTARLIERAGRLVAVEFDRELAPVLRERYGPHANFTLIEGDALTTDFCAAIEPAI